MVEITDHITEYITLSKHDITRLEEGQSIIIHYKEMRYLIKLSQ